MSEEAEPPLEVGEQPRGNPWSDSLTTALSQQSNMLAVVGPDQPLTDDVGEEPNFEDAIGPSATVERAPAEVKVEVFWSGADEICVCSDQLGQDGDNVEERTESIEFRDEQKQKRREKQDEKEGRKQKLKRKRTEEREQDQDQEQQQEQEQEEEQKRKRKQKRKHMQEQKGEQEKEQEQEQEQGQGRKVELKFTGKRRVAELKGDTFPPSQASQVGSPVALEPGAIVYAQWDDMLWYRGIVSLVFLAESTETQEGSTKEAPMVVDGRSFPNATRLTVKLDDGTVCVCGDDEVVSLAQFPTKLGDRATAPWGRGRQGKQGVRHQVVLAKFEEDGTVWVRIVRGDKLDRDSWNIDTGLLAPPETKTLPPVLVTSHAVKKEGPVNMEDKLHLLRTSRVSGKVRLIADGVYNAFHMRCLFIFAFSTSSGTWVVQDSTAVEDDLVRRVADKEMRRRARLHNCLDLAEYGVPPPWLEPACAQYRERLHLDPIACALEAVGDPLNGAEGRLHLLGTDTQQAIFASFGKPGGPLLKEGWAFIEKRACALGDNIKITGIAHDAFVHHKPLPPGVQSIGGLRVQY